MSSVSGERFFHSISGGGGSWLAAKVKMKARPDAEHKFVFTDVLYEDADAYRFLIEGVANLLDRRLNWSIKAEDFPSYQADPETPIEAYRGNPEWRAFLSDLRDRATAAIPELIWLVDGRDPWEVYRDERFLGNNRIDPCSKFLKRLMFKRWRNSTCFKQTDVFIVGIGPDEKHRFDDGKGGGIGPRMRGEGWRYEAPLIGTLEGEIGPFFYLDAAGIARPRLYRLGYMHNNCGGMCCKAGKAHWKNRLLVQPDRFAYDKMMEQKLIAYLGSDVSMMARVNASGEKEPLTLADFETIILSQPQASFQFLPGDSGCGCFLDGDEP
ncbi:hypothetical protein ACI6PO_06430 [Agrobacterium tumefaciens]